MNAPCRIEELDAKLILRRFEQIAGSPEDSEPIDISIAWDTTFQGLVIYVYAFFYTNSFEGNIWLKSPRLLDAIERTGERLWELLRGPGAGHLGRRTGYPLCHAFGMMRDHVREPDKWKKEIVRILREVYLPALEERKHLRQFTSANCGYGSNHLAVELTSLTSYVATFRGDDDFDQMDPGGKNLVHFAESFLDRFMEYMNDGGYWAECDGPANLYNSLTANALLRATLDLDMVDKYRSHFEKAAAFHTYFVFPNLLTAGVTDGRNPQGTSGARLAFCGFIPEGRALLDLIKTNQSEDTKTPAPPITGEGFFELLFSIVAEQHLPEGAAPVAWDKESFTHTIGDDFAMIKRGQWMVSAANFEFRPRPEGHFNLDYQNLFSLYHTAFGVIFKGTNSKNDPRMSTFHKGFMTFDGHSIDEPMWKYIPGKGRLDINDDGLAVYRDYRGFEGSVAITVNDPTEAVLTFEANTRLKEYPIMASLQPAIVHGQSFESGTGETITIDEKAFSYTGKDLGGYIILQPEPRPDIRKTTSGRPIKISIPEDATLSWPYKRWDVYNQKTDRYEQPGQWTVLLEIPVGSTEVEMLLKLV